ncbi:unnamed protein product [Microthlaspi erraticum]|uniref:Uncharacterized protein n=1 Tax=Microthlaspi erraticum TaxID=1685480 RepID=A0A6D2IYH5_9BRAS|nr:unnamed protein product [Microthlaspi erraticum]
MPRTRLPCLPDEIVSRVIQLVGIGSIKYLGPFIRAGRRTYDIVFSDDVLKHCNVLPAFTDEISQPYGSLRNILLRCVRSGNENAIYFEGLSLFYFYNEYEEGIALLDRIASTFPAAAIASATFSVCLGHYREASAMYELFTRVTGFGLEDERAQSFGRQLLHALWWVPPSWHNPNPPDFQYPGLPDCVYVGNMHWHTCNKCYMFQLARIVCNKVCNEENT